MRRQILFVFAFALLSAANSSAQKTRLPDHFGNWITTGSPSSGVPSASGESPWGQTGPGGTLRALAEPVYREAGAKWEELRVYTKGKSRISVYLAELRDASSAYELYTHELRAGMKKANAGQVSAIDDHMAAILVGSLVVEVWNPKGVSAPELNQLLASLHTNKTPLPPIPEYLPVDGRADGTERYALGPAALRAAAESAGKPEIAGLADAAGFTQGAEAMLAQYRRGRDSGVLLLIDYPTPQLAELHSRHLETALAETPKEAGIKIERKGSLLSMVIAPSSPTYAESLRGAVNYETQVTWNEPSGTATDAPWGVVLYRIFVGTGIFMVAAVVLGIGFGGLRIFTKRLFPGKVFDRPEQMEVLQLGLSGKRIDPRDFY